jgi:hypothetical protein
MPTNRLHTRIARAAATLCLAAGAAVAQAGTVDIRFDDPIFGGLPSPHHDVVTITYPTAGGSRSATVAAGRFQGTASNLVGVSASIFVDSLDDVFMYCYDLYETVSPGQSATYTVNFDGALARTLDFLGAVNAVLNAGKASDDPYAWLHPTSGYMAAAIQLGIWESKYDDSGWSLGAGAFRATGLEAATSGFLNQFVAAIPGSASLDARYVMTLEARGIQDMITGDPPAAVPEPGTLGLLAAAAAALALRGRRRIGVPRPI